MFFLVTRVLSALGGSGAPPAPPQKRLVVDEQVLWESLNKSVNTLDAFQKLIDGELKKVMEIEMANAAARAARATPPLNGGDISKAEKNIEDDINYIFRPLESIPFGSLVLARYWTGVEAYKFQFKSKRLQKAYDQKQWETVYKAFANKGMGKFTPYDEDFLMLTASPSKAQHRGAMDNRGRLNGVRWHVTGSKDAAQGKIDTYIKFMQQGIGKMAGGWIKCFVMLKGMGWNLPLDWAAKGRAKVTRQMDGPNKEITIENMFGNYGGWADQRHATLNFILNDCANNGAKRYVRVCQDTADKLNMS